MVSSSRRRRSATWAASGSPVWPLTSASAVSLNVWPSTDATWSSERPSAGRASSLAATSAWRVVGIARSPSSRVGRYVPSSALARRPSATSIRTVSTAYSGMPLARARTSSTTSDASPGTRPSSSSRMDPSASGSTRAAMAPRRSVPHPGRRSSSSGRASVITKIGWSRLQSSRCSMKSSSPSSAQWMSSNTRPTVPSAASRSKNVRQAANSSSRPPDGASASPSRTSSRGSIQRRSASSGTCSSTIRATAARVVGSSSPSVRPARRRTISPSAQNVTPSP